MQAPIMTVPLDGKLSDILPQIGELGYDVVTPSPILAGKIPAGGFAVSRYTDAEFTHLLTEAGVDSWQGRVVYSGDGMLLMVDVPFGWMTGVPRFTVCLATLIAVKPTPLLSFTSFWESWRSWIAATQTKQDMMYHDAAEYPHLLAEADKYKYRRDAYIADMVKRYGSEYKGTEEMDDNEEVVPAQVIPTKKEKKGKE